MALSGRVGGRDGARRRAGRRRGVRGTSRGDRHGDTRGEGEAIHRVELNVDVRGQRRRDRDRRVEQRRCGIVRAVRDPQEARARVDDQRHPLERTCADDRSRDADAVKATLAGANRADGPQFFIPDDPELFSKPPRPCFKDARVGLLVKLGKYK